MKKEVLLALIEALVEDSLIAYREENPNLRGPRGKSGKDFRYEEHRDAIFSQITEAISNIQNDLKLQFSDLSEEDIQSLRGSQGIRGPKGKDFNYEENATAIDTAISSIFDRNFDSLKLTYDKLTPDQKAEISLSFSDLTEEDKLELRGPRGQKGKQGQRGDIGSQGEQGIQGETGSQGIQGEIGEKGPRGQKGKQGSQGFQGEIGAKGDSGENGLPGEKGEQGDIGDKGPRGQKGRQGSIGETGPKGDIGERGIRGLPGPQGLRGLDGVDGLSIEGPKGKDAPVVVDIEVKKVTTTDAYMAFTYDDGTVLDTNRFKLPISQIVQQYSQNIIQQIQDSGAIEAAEALVVEKVCDEDIDITKFVTATSGTNVALAQSNLEAKATVMGVALEAKLTGETVKILMFGNRNHAVFSGIDLNANFYLSTNGNYSTVMPTSGFRVVLGYGTGDSGVFIKIEEAIEI